MNTDDAVKVLLEHLGKSEVKAPLAQSAVNHYERRCRQILESGMTVQTKREEIDRERNYLLDQLHRYATELPADVAARLENVLTPATTKPPAPVPPPVHAEGPGLFQFQLGADSAEQYRRHLVKLVELWNAVGIMGFICADQGQVPALMEHIGMLKRIAKL